MVLVVKPCGSKQLKVDALRVPKYASFTHLEPYLQLPEQSSFD